MIRRLMQFLLRRLVGPFLENDVELDHLEVNLNLWGGKVTISQLELSVEAINKFLIDTPFQLLSGSFGSVSLTLNISWKNLSEAQCTVDIENLTMLFGLRKDVSSDIPVEEMDPVEALLASTNSKNMAHDFRLNFDEEQDDDGDEYMEESYNLEIPQDKGLEKLSEVFDSILSRVQVNVYGASLRFQHHSEFVQEPIKLAINIPELTFRDRTQVMMGDSILLSSISAASSMNTNLGSDLTGANNGLADASSGGPSSAAPGGVPTDPSVVLPKPTILEKEITLVNGFKVQLHEQSPGLPEHVTVFIQDVNKNRMNVKIKQPHCTKPIPLIDIDGILKSLNVLIMPRHYHLLMEMMNQINLVSAKLANAHNHPNNDHQNSPPNFSDSAPPTAAGPTSMQPNDYEKVFFSMGRSLTSFASTATSSLSFGTGSVLQEEDEDGRIRGLEEEEDLFHKLDEETTPRPRNSSNASQSTKASECDVPGGWMAIKFTIKAIRVFILPNDYERWDIVDLNRELRSHLEMEQPDALNSPDSLAGGESVSYNWDFENLPKKHSHPYLQRHILLNITNFKLDIQTRPLGISIFNSTTKSLHIREYGDWNHYQSIITFDSNEFDLLSPGTDIRYSTFVPDNQIRSGGVINIHQETEMTSDGKCVKSPWNIRMLPLLISFDFLTLERFRLFFSHPQVTSVGLSSASLERVVLKEEEELLENAENTPVDTSLLANAIIQCPMVRLHVYAPDTVKETVNHQQKEEEEESNNGKDISPPEEEERKTHKETLLIDFHQVGFNIIPSPCLEIPSKAQWVLNWEFDSMKVYLKHSNDTPATLLVLSESLLAEEAKERGLLQFVSKPVLPMSPPMQALNPMKDHQTLMENFELNCISKSPLGMNVFLPSVVCHFTKTDFEIADILINELSEWNPALLFGDSYYITMPTANPFTETVYYPATDFQQSILMSGGSGGGGRCSSSNRRGVLDYESDSDDAELSGIKGNLRDYDEDEGDDEEEIEQEEQTGEEFEGKNDAVLQPYHAIAISVSIRQTDIRFVEDEKTLQQLRASHDAKSGPAPKEEELRTYELLLHNIHVFKVNGYYGQLINYLTLAATNLWLFETQRNGQSRCILHRLQCPPEYPLCDIVLSVNFCLDYEKIKNVSLEVDLYEMTMRYESDISWIGRLMNLTEEPPMLGVGLTFESKYTQLSLAAHQCSIDFHLSPKRDPIRSMLTFDLLRCTSNILDTPSFRMDFHAKTPRLFVVDNPDCVTSAVKMALMPPTLSPFPAYNFVKNTVWSNLERGENQNHWPTLWEKAGFVKLLNLSTMDVCLKKSPERTDLEFVFGKLVGRFCADSFGTFQRFVDMLVNPSSADNPNVNINPNDAAGASSSAGVGDDTPDTPSTNPSSTTNSQLLERNRNLLESLEDNVFSRAMPEDEFVQQEDSDSEYQDVSEYFTDNFGTDADYEHISEEFDMVHDAGSVRSFGVELEGDAKEEFKTTLISSEEIIRFNTTEDALAFDENFFNRINTTEPTPVDNDSHLRDLPKEKSFFLKFDFNTIIIRLYDGLDWHTSMEKNPVMEKDDEIDAEAVGIPVLPGHARFMRGQRSFHSYLDIKMYSLRILSSTYLPNSHYDSSFLVHLRDIEIIDNLPTSNWKTLLSYMRPGPNDAPRESNSDMLRFEQIKVHPNPKSPETETRMKVAVLPIRLYIDQDVIEFLMAFFGYQSPTALPPSPPAPAKDEEKVFFQQIEIKRIRIRLDFKPKILVLGSQTTISELGNLLKLEDADHTLREIKLYGIDGWKRLIEQIFSKWQLGYAEYVSLASGVTLVRSLVNVGVAALEMFLLPVAKYKKDGRIIPGVQQGATSFLHTAALETMNISSQIAVGTQVLLIRANNAFSSGPSDSIENDGASLYADQPSNIVEGLKQGASSLSSNLVIAGYSLFVVPQYEYQQSGSMAAVKSVLRNTPAAILRPMIGATNAMGKVILGARNTISPEHQIATQLKYKGQKHFELLEKEEETDDPM